VITIRSYRASDCDTVLDIFNRSIREVACRDYSPAQVAAWAHEDRDMAAFAAKHASRPTFIAEVDGAAAGFSDLETDGLVDFLFVHPGFQRRGVGRALLSHIEALARRQGPARLYAQVSITARPLFEACGFGVRAIQSVEHRGQTFTNYRMEKRL
jgi:putative acetyltransferase